LHGTKTTRMQLRDLVKNARRKITTNMGVCPVTRYRSIAKTRTVRKALQEKRSHFFLPPAAASSLRSQEMTLPNITTPFPSMKATRDKPSQFLNVSQTNGC